MGTQVISSPSLTVGGQQSDIFLNDLYPPYAGLSSIADLKMDRLSDFSFNPFIMQAPELGQEQSSVRRTSMTMSRSPPPRDRTPIRHHRAPAPRARSTSRSEALLIYATDQQRSQHAVPLMQYGSSQSAPTTPHNYPMSNLALQPVLSSTHPETNGYFESIVPTQNHSSLPEISVYDSATAMNPYYLSSTRDQIADSMLSYSYSDLPDASFMPQTLPPHATQLPPMGHSMPLFPPILAPLESVPSNLESLATRPKPQCWDHGCNGRQFSTFSNLLRHQREKSGSAMKATCPHCGTEFTRTTARNGHLYGGKCKGRADQSTQATADEPQRSMEPSSDEEISPSDE